MNLKITPRRNLLLASLICGAIALGDTVAEAQTSEAIPAVDPVADDVPYKGCTKIFDDKSFKGWEGGRFDVDYRRWSHARRWRHLPSGVYEGGLW